MLDDAGFWPRKPHTNAAWDECGKILLKSAKNKLNYSERAFTVELMNPLVPYEQCSLIRLVVTASSSRTLFCPEDNEILGLCPTQRVACDIPLWCTGHSCVDWLGMQVHQRVPSQRGLRTSHLSFPTPPFSLYKAWQTGFPCLFEC
jgi:hypothetical protein